MPPVTLPTLNAGLVNLNANLNLVRQQIVNINNSYNSISRNTNNITNTTNLIHNQDDRDIIHLLNEIVRTGQNIERETSALKTDISLNHQSVTYSLSSINNEIKNVVETINTGFRESTTLINQSVIPNT
jgi:hypothetical protein